MNARQGFTLIEVMMAGVISSAIPLLVMATLRMNNSQLQKGTSRIRLTQVYDVVSEDIHRAAYASAFARQAPCEDTHIVELCGVLFQDKGGAFQKGFRVRKPSVSSNVGVLEEMTAPATTWSTFRAGSDSVTVKTNLTGFAVKVAGLFNVYNPTGVANAAEGVRFNLRLNMAIGVDTEALSVQTESVLCRNAPPWVNIL